jgi:hypothetical protein
VRGLSWLLPRVRDRLNIFVVAAGHVATAGGIVRASLLAIPIVQKSIRSSLFVEAMLICICRINAADCVSARGSPRVRS